MKLEDLRGWPREYDAQVVHEWGKVTINLLYKDELVGIGGIVYDPEDATDSQGLIGLFRSAEQAIFIRRVESGEIELPDSVELPPASSSLNDRVHARETVVPVLKRATPSDSAGRDELLDS